jgi:hypothetical protein
MQISRLPAMLDQITRNIPNTGDPTVASVAHVQRFWTPKMIHEALDLSRADPELFSPSAQKVLSQLAPLAGIRDAGSSN